MNELLKIAAVAVMAITASAQAPAQSNPFLGTWRHNLAKSKLNSGALAKEEILTIKRVGGQDQVTVNGTEVDGTPISMKFEFPDKGGPGKFIVGPYDAVSVKFVDTSTREVSEMKGGKEVLHLHWAVSKDRGTLSMTVKGTNTQGKPVSGVSVWDRQ